MSFPFRQQAKVPEKTEEELRDYYERQAPEEFWAPFLAALITFVPVILLIIGLTVGIGWLMFFAFA